MPSLNLLVVGNEKVLPEFEEALESCKRYVGPVKLFTAHKAVDAVGRLQKLVQTCGQCHAAFLDNHFTCPGKEEFSETLRKVIKEKYPDVPVICWGNPKKGGDLNKHYHATLEFSKNGADVNALVDVLKQVQSGQIRADYLHKDQRKSLERRNSLDRTDSIRGGAAPRADSLLRRTDSRRASQEGARPPALDRAMSSRRSAEAPDEVASPAVAGGAGGMQSVPTLRRKSTERRGSESSGLNGGGMMSMGSLNNGMLGGMAPMASMNNGMASGMMGGGMMNPMSSMNNGMAMHNGMGGSMMNPAGSMNNGMAMGMGGGMGMAGGMAVGGIMNPMGSMNARMGGDLNTMMASVALNGAVGSGIPPAPAQPAAAVPAGAAAGGGNAELIRMLAEEVVRLRKAVEEKRAREAHEVTAAAMQQQQQLLELQQQQLLLQQQLLAAGGSTSGRGLGVGIGGGMPMGI